MDRLSKDEMLAWSRKLLLKSALFMAGIFVGLNAVYLMLALISQSREFVLFGLIISAIALSPIYIFVSFLYWRGIRHIKSLEDW